MNRQGTNLCDVRIGDMVEIVQKADHYKGSDLKNSDQKGVSFTGIKVQLRTGEIGRVQKIID